MDVEIPEGIPGDDGATRLLSKELAKIQHTIVCMELKLLRVELLKTKVIYQENPVLEHLRYIEEMIDEDVKKKGDLEALIGHMEAWEEVERKRKMIRDDAE